MNQSFWQEHRKVLTGLGATLFFAVAVLFLQGQTTEFMATLLEVEKPAPFDGTALPISEVPDWADLSASEFKLLSAELPQQKFIELPNYDPIIFGTVVASTNWQADRELVNKLITFAVPYMGSYELHSREYDGSHLAVDIKIPVGTPIHAIANGKVVKVAESSAGFGRHIVIRHDNVPLLDENETTTLYSAYAHLSKISVQKNQIVTRGELIASSGNSGISTTPHLHFQIDNENAPWHPWWPFSSAEAAAAGVSFFDGVSAGLNQDLAITNTVNPMLWVQRYLAATLEVPEGLHAASKSTADTETKSEANITESEEVVKMTESEEESDNNVDVISVEEESQDEEIVAEEENREATENDTTKESQQPTVEDLEPIFSDVATDHPNFAAIKYLAENEIVAGYPDGSFQPAKTVSRVEALKMIILGFDIEVTPMLDLGFSDTSNQQWYSPFVGTAVKREIAKGYPDGSFGPGKTVNRAEYLKILIGSAGTEVEAPEVAPYDDVPVEAWFAGFAEHSKARNIFPIAGNTLDGGAGVTRAEVAETIYRMIVLRNTSAEKYSTDLEP